jgi:hypothetical protein
VTPGGVLASAPPTTGSHAAPNPVEGTESAPDAFGLTPRESVPIQAVSRGASMRTFVEMLPPTHSDSRE